MVVLFVFQPVVWSSRHLNAEIYSYDEPKAQFWEFKQDQAVAIFFSSSKEVRNMKPN